MEITGTIKLIKEEQQVSEKFRKKEFVITDNSSKYPQHILLQLAQDKCGLLDNCNIGDEIKAHFNLRGRGWTNPQGEEKWFTTLDVWKLETISKGSEQSFTDATKVDDNFRESSNNGVDDGLPF